MAGARDYGSACARQLQAGTLEVWYDHLEAGELLEMMEREVRRASSASRSTVR